MTQGSKNAVFPKPQTPLLVKIQLPSECGMESQETWHRASHPLSPFEQLWNSVFSSTFIPGFHSSSPQNGWMDMGQMSHEWLHRGGVGGPAAHRWPLLLVLGQRTWRQIGSKDLSISLWCERWRNTGFSWWVPPFPYCSFANTLILASFWNRLC